MAVTSPCSSTSFSRWGGQRSSSRRPQRGQVHSSACSAPCSTPCSTRLLRTISCLSATVFTHPVVPRRHLPGSSAARRQGTHAATGREWRFLAAAEADERAELLGEGGFGECLGGPGPG